MLFVNCVVLILINILKFSFSEILIGHSGNITGTLDYQTFYEFGRPYRNSTWAQIVIAYPPTGCSSVQKLPIVNVTVKNRHPLKWSILVETGVCELHTKIMNAQRNGFSNIIIIQELKFTKPSYHQINLGMSKYYKINVATVTKQEGNTLRKIALAKKHFVKIELDKTYKELLIIYAKWLWKIYVEGIKTAATQLDQNFYQAYIFYEKLGINLNILPRMFCLIAFIIVFFILKKLSAKKR